MKHSFEWSFLVIMTGVVTPLLSKKKLFTDLVRPTRIALVVLVCIQH